MKRHLQLIIIALCLALASCQAAPDRQESRMDRSRLNIGAYILQPYARSEAHIKDLADCGIDFVICIDNYEYPGSRKRLYDQGYYAGRPSREGDSY